MSNRLGYSDVVCDDCGKSSDNREGWSYINIKMLEEKIHKVLDFIYLCPLCTQELLNKYKEIDV